MTPRNRLSRWSHLHLPERIGVQLKTGQAGALTPELLALTPESARASVNHAPLDAARQQVAH